MPLDPPVQFALDQLAAQAAGLPDPTTIPLPILRSAFSQFSKNMITDEMVVPVGSVEDISIPGEAGPIPARIYRPAVAGAVPTVLFTHGGAFFQGDIETHDNQVRWLCTLTGSVVVSIDYRLIPEHPFPAGLDDVNSSVRWVFGNVESLGGDPSRIGLAGDSAGGNLTAVAAQEARDAGLVVKAQLLLYPLTDLMTTDSDQSKFGSRQDFATGYMLTWPGLVRAGSTYGEGQDPTSPRLSPLEGNLGDLPPTVVATAEYDPLRDEGEQYGESLTEAGVETVTIRVASSIHGFFNMSEFSPASAAGVRESCAQFARLLNAPAGAAS